TLGRARSSDNRGHSGSAKRAPARAKPLPPQSQARSRADGIPPGLQRAADLLGIAGRPIEEDGHVVGVTLDVCPACKGRDGAGSLARGTAHLTAVKLTLRCNCKGCEA